jgi:HUS1 checkpoint protein
MMTIVQDIPVTMLTAAQQASYVEPDMPDPTVYIMMPRLVNVAKLMDRLKNMSDTVTIRANMNGCLRFQVKTDLIKINTFYDGLEHPQIRMLIGTHTHLSLSLSLSL